MANVRCPLPIELFFRWRSSNPGAVSNRTTWSLGHLEISAADAFHHSVSTWYYLTKRSFLRLERPSILLGRRPWIPPCHSFHKGRHRPLFPAFVFGSSTSSRERWRGRYKLRPSVKATRIREECSLSPSRSRRAQLPKDLLAQGQETTGFLYRPNRYGRGIDPYVRRLQRHQGHAGVEAANGPPPLGPRMVHQQEASAVAPQCRV